MDDHKMVEPMGCNLKEVEKQALYYALQQEQEQAQMHEQVQEQAQEQEQMQEQAQEQAQSATSASENGIMRSNMFPNEVLMHIFACLPPLTLLTCDSVCKRFRWCGRDKSLWNQVHITREIIKSGMMEYIMKRKPTELTLNRTVIHDPIFRRRFFRKHPNYQESIKVLHLRGISSSGQAIAMLISRCVALRDLTMDMINMDMDICREVAKCVDLQSLKILDCPVDAWGMLMPLERLTTLHISTSFFTVDSLTTLVIYLPATLVSLILEGCKENIIDAHLKVMVKCCPQLRELRLIDCSGLTANAVRILRRCANLEVASFHQCDEIGHLVDMKFRRTNGATLVQVAGIVTEDALFLIERTYLVVTFDDDDN